MPEARSRTAALLDRDGTIIFDSTYIHSPDDVRLLDGAADAIKRFTERGYPVIVCTNQSGIARGLITFEQYHLVRTRVNALLAEHGACILDSFACPHHPDFTGPCSCRKPETGLYVRAARLYDLDLSRCFFVGDKFRDVAPAFPFGARTALTRSSVTLPDDIANAEKAHVPIVEDLAAAADLLLPAR